VAKEIIRFYSDRISLKYLKIKLETFSFAVKLYDLKINLYAKYIAVETKSIVAM